MKKKYITIIIVINSAIAISVGILSIIMFKGKKIRK